MSRALYNPSIVTADTRERVLKAVRRMGYTPNIAARNLRARRTMMVPVVVPDIANPFFSEVLRGIDEALSAAGYGLIIGNLDSARDKDARFVNVVFAGQVDGVLLLNGRLPQGGRGFGLAEGPVPVVAACEVIPKAGIPQVEVQNREAAQSVGEHLLALGHRRFGYIAGPKANILERERAADFRQALTAAGLSPRAVTVFTGDFTFKAGSAAGEKFLALARRPSAVFAANDEMAIGFLKTVTAAGVRVPDDVSVVGFDGIDFADYCEPTLTTIVQPRRLIGQTAARLLVERMTGEEADEDAIVRLSTTLLVRESSGPIR